mmetsp:Transcript_56799/g.103868  ORF Transcript_56799/g.103868 Transcript_56799/m.103868 type:complete len:436 (+) Transcript_56799:1-1308(+)
MHLDLMYVYVVNRWIAMIETGVVLASVTNVAWWTTKNADGEFTKFIVGQWCNVCMSFAFFLLTYAPTIMLDTQLAQSVKQAIGGQLEGAPALLSGVSNTSASLLRSEEGAVINAKVPLVWTGLVLASFGTFMLVNPFAFLSQYSIKFSNINQADKMMVASVIQNWGIWNMLMVGFCSIACRVGSERTRMHINLANAVSFLVNTSLVLAGFDTFTRLGCSTGGLIFNICLLAFTAVLSGLGAGFSFKLPPYKNPIYWGGSVMAVVAFVYSVLFLLIPEQLLNSYHMPLTMLNNEVSELILSCFKYGWSGVFFQMFAMLLAGMMHLDLMYVYAVNRWIAIIETGVVLVCVTNVAWWTTKNEDTQLTKFIELQWTNVCMSFTFVFLTYMPIAMLDTQLAQSLKQAIGGQFEGEGAPTLLSPSKRKPPADAFKVPLVDY